MDDDEKKRSQNSMVIKAEDDVAKGRFSNMAQVTSTQDAVVLDFAFIQSHSGWLLSRILMSPQHAKRFNLALTETLAKHEARFGKIEGGPTLQ